MISVCNSFLVLFACNPDLGSSLIKFLQVLVGNIVGFEAEARLAAKQAGEFLKGCREMSIKM
jgi:hypothetical protein